MAIVFLFSLDNSKFETLIFDDEFILTCSPSYNAIPKKADDDCRNVEFWLQCSGSNFLIAKVSNIVIR